MSPVKDSPPQGTRTCWSRWPQAGVAYLVLAGLGTGVLFEFVPDIFDFGELSAFRLLLLVAFFVFVVAPVVAISYIAFSVFVEALFAGVGWAFKAGFRAVAGFFKRTFYGRRE